MQLPVSFSVSPGANRHLRQKQEEDIKKKDRGAEIERDHKKKGRRGHREGKERVVLVRLRPSRTRARAGKEPDARKDTRTLQCTDKLHLQITSLKSTQALYICTLIELKNTSQRPRPHESEKLQLKRTHMLTLLSSIQTAAL